MKKISLTKSELIELSFLIEDLQKAKNIKATTDDEMSKVIDSALHILNNMRKRKGGHKYEKRQSVACSNEQVFHVV